MDPEKAVSKHKRICSVYKTKAVAGQHSLLELSCALSSYDMAQ